MDKKLPLSVALVSFNEEDNIERTLRAVLPIASEIVMVDSHSTDKTREIAALLGARVYEEDWKGFRDQKNSAMEKCTQPWILNLDCDEVADEKLVAEIEEAVSGGQFNGYALNRKTFYMGRFLSHSWQPDRKLRLVRASANPAWVGNNLHESLSVEGKTSVLQGALLHYSYKDTFDHYQRLVKYSRIAAEAYDKNGRKFSYFSLFLQPPFAFIKKYFLKAGFLDGFAGLAVAVSSFIYVYLKYLFLKEIQEGKNKNG